MIMPNFDMNEAVPKLKDSPVESFDVEVKSKPEPVLPIIPNKTNNKPSQVKQVTKPKRGPLPKLNVKPKREISKTPAKKEGAHKYCLLENSEINNPKTKRFSQGAPESRRIKSPKTKPRQPLRPQKAEEITTESVEPPEQTKAIEPAMKDLVENNQQMGTPDTPCDSFVSPPMIDDCESHKELDHFGRYSVYTISIEWNTKLIPLYLGILRYNKVSPVKDLYCFHYRSKGSSVRKPFRNNVSDVEHYKLRK